MISPLSKTRPSGVRMFQDAPFFHSDSWVVPTQYFFVNSGLVSASHSFSEVVRIQMT